MTKLAWDQTGERYYETGVDHGVLYLPNSQGVYDSGVSWNGLTTVTESPTGAESNPQYADNIKYLNLVSAEEFGATVEAFTYPDEFAQCDGTAMPQPGVSVGQQTRKIFGMCYRTRLGNDLQGSDYGYKLHLIYGALAAPSEKPYATINDSPEAITFSWELTTTPIEVGMVDSVDYKPAASLTIDSSKVDATALSTLEDFLYGTEGTDPSLPLPAEVLGLFSGTVMSVTPTEPTYDSATDMITIPTVTGVNYYVDDMLVTESYGPITENTLIVARPATGYRFPSNVDDDWLITFVE